MSDRQDILLEITPTVVLKAYACGIFPMAEAADDPGLFWVEPDKRGVLPLNGFHVPRSLKKIIRQGKFQVTFNQDFPSVIDACAKSTQTRKKTWINRRIHELYCELHEMGHAHSVECWYGEQLAGGLYGVSLGRAFFGESMFTRERDASKVALVYLVAALKKGGYELLDTQFTTEHLERFGAVEVPRKEYQKQLDYALQSIAQFDTQLGGATSDSILQLVSQIS